MPPKSIQFHAISGHIFETTLHKGFSSIYISVVGKPKFKYSQFVFICCGLIIELTFILRDNEFLCNTVTLELGTITIQQTSFYSRVFSIFSIQDHRWLLQGDSNGYGISPATLWVAKSNINFHMLDSVIYCFILYNARDRII